MKLLVIILVILIAIVLLLIWRINQVNRNNYAIIERQQQQISQVEAQLNSVVDKEPEQEPEPEPEREPIEPQTVEVVNFSINRDELDDFKDRINQQLEDILSSTSEGKAYKDNIASLQQDIAESKEEKMTNNDSDTVLKHSHFLSLLSTKYPQLSKNDLQLCVYLYEGLPTKDIAEKMDKKVRSIESSRNRLRKKMGIEAGMDFSSVFSDITDEEK